MDYLVKICRTCNKEKGLHDFHKDPKGKFGVYSSCKACRCPNHKTWGKLDRKEYMRRYVKNRRHNDINFKMACNMRRRVRCAISRGGYSKSARLSEYLGCDWSTFKQHIESKFTEGMSWYNHGDWHLDHIKPLCLFNLSNKEEMLKAGHYTNLQPLWAKDNLSKGSKF